MSDQLSEAQLEAIRTHVPLKKTGKPEDVAAVFCTSVRVWRTMSRVRYSRKWRTLYVDRMLMALLPWL